MAYILLMLGTMAYEWSQDNNFFHNHKSFRFFKKTKPGRPIRLTYNIAHQVQQLNEMEIFLLREVFVLSGAKTMHGIFTRDQAYKLFPKIHHMSL